jgi:EmrB/QacA subfamily drug resistance transporter
MGMAGLVIGFAPAIGPTLGGFIIDQFAWRYLFYTVLPIAMIVMILAIFLMKNVTEQKNVKVDSASIILSSFGWGGLLYGFSIVGSVGWGNLTFILSVLIGAISLTLFIKRQNKQEMPMLNFAVFKSKEFTITTVLSVMMFAILIAAETILPLYVQHVKGGTALQSGSMLLPGALITGIMSPIAGKMFDKSGAKGMSIIGFCFILLGTILYINIGMDTPILFIAVIFLLKMFGMSLLMTPLMTSGINSLPPHLIPHGTAMQSTIRMVGASIGTALIVSVMSFSASTSTSANPIIALLDGIHTAFFGTVLMAIIGLILSFSLKNSYKQKQIMQE